MRQSCHLQSLVAVGNYLTYHLESIFGGAHVEGNTRGLPVEILQSEMKMLQGSNIQQRKIWSDVHHSKLLPNPISRRGRYLFIVRANREYITLLPPDNVIASSRVLDGTPSTPYCAILTSVATDGTPAPQESVILNDNNGVLSKISFDIIHVRGPFCSEWHGAGDT